MELLQKVIIKISATFIYLTGLLITGISIYYFIRYLLFDRTEANLLILITSFIATIVYMNYVEKKIQEMAMHTLFNLFAKQSEKNNGVIDESK